MHSNPRKLTFVTNLHAIQTFGALLRLLRLRAQLTQRDLAAKVGYSYAQINRLEKGKRQAEPDVVAALFVSALGLEPNALEAIKLVDLARQPLKTAANHANGSPATEPAARPSLPLPATKLLGRESDIQSLTELLGDESVRLLSLVGPPGVGKTRLAIRLATDLESQYQHGAVFVALSPISDSALIADAVLQALGVTSNRTNPVIQLENILRNQHRLLVFDNFEQLLGQTSAALSANVVAALLAVAPQVKIIVTSRAALRLSHEQVYEVPSLDPTSAHDLFVSRATAVNPAFRLRGHDEKIVADICQRLDHLPLAIELAAARTRLFEPQTLLKRLAAPLAFLTAGPHDLPPRQRKLRDAIAWSYDLLSPEEQLLFRRLGTFEDGCTLPMIEAVMGDDLPHAIEDVVQSLIEKSLLKIESIHATTRFRLLEMLREFARDLLTEAGEAEAVAIRKAEWFVGQVTMMQSDPAIGDSVIWFDWFDVEINNIRSVIQWSMQSNCIEYGLQLAANLWQTWRLHGPLREGLQLLSDLTVHPKAQENLHLYAQVLFSKANVTKEAGDLALSKACFIEALKIFRTFGDKKMTAWALSHLGDRACGDADYALACELLDESVILFREVNDKKGLAWAFLWLALVASEQGNIQHALGLCAEARQISNKLGSPILSYLTAGWTAFVYNNCGELDQSRNYAETALAICVANKLIGSATIMRSTLGSIALHQGDLDYAAIQLECVREAQERHGNPDLSAGTLIELGFVEHLRGNTTYGESCLKSGLQVHWDVQRVSSIPGALIRLAWIAADQHNCSRAAKLMGAVSALHRQLGSVPSFTEAKHHVHRQDAVQSNLGPHDFERWWHEGEVMDCAAAVNFALKQH